MQSEQSRRVKMRRYSKILAHIPHSSIQNYSYGWISCAYMFEDVKYKTDWHTDVLFRSHNSNVDVMIFPYSRFYVDVERLENDPLEAEGQGKIYKRYNDFRRDLLTEEDIKMLNGIYSDWRSKCNERIVDNTLVIDCHSFSNDLAPDVDVCIGYNDDESKPDDEVIDFIADEFSSLGYGRIAFNKPYSNSITFSHPHHSVMIELNKSIYMDEETLIMKPYCYRVASAINGIYDRLTGLGTLY